MITFEQAEAKAKNIANEIKFYETVIETLNNSKTTIESFDGKIYNARFTTALRKVSNDVLSFGKTQYSDFVVHGYYNNNYFQVHIVYNLINRFTDQPNQVAIYNTENGLTDKRADILSNDSGKNRIIASGWVELFNSEVAILNNKIEYLSQYLDANVIFEAYKEKERLENKIREVVPTCLQ